MPGKVILRRINANDKDSNFFLLDHDLSDELRKKLMTNMIEVSHLSTVVLMYANSNGLKNWIIITPF